MAMDKKYSKKVFAEKRDVSFNYQILDTYECGISLEGWEVKSIVQGHISINESYVKIINNEVYLVGAYVSSSSQSSDISKFFNGGNDSTRSKKLLMNRREIDKLNGKIQASGLTLVPLRVYYNSKNKIKIAIALCEGKKNFDKRQDQKNKSIDLELKRIVKSQKSF
jgi:SsrA-binding protein